MNKAKKTEAVISRLDVELMKRVRLLAKAEDRTIAKTINRLLVEALEKKGKGLQC